MNNPRNDRTPAREMLRLALETQSAGMLPGDGARLAASDVHPDENELALYLSRELPPQASDRIEAHLAGCGECTEVVVLAAASGRKATSGQPPRSVARPAHADGAASGIERRLSAVTSRTRSAGAGMEIPGPMTAAPARGASPAVNETQTGRVARPTARPARSGWHRFRAAASIALLLLAGGVATAGWFALLAPDLTRILLAAVPAAASLGVHEGRLAVPFSLVGTWPDLRIAVPASGQPAR